MTEAKREALLIELERNAARSTLRGALKLIANELGISIRHDRHTISQILNAIKRLKLDDKAMKEAV